MSVILKTSSLLISNIHVCFSILFHLHSKTDDSVPATQQSQPVHATFSRISIIIIIICTILDIFLVLYIVVSGSSADNGVPQEPLQTLSTYMNLDELYAKKQYNTRHRPIINMPRNYFQVSSAHPRAQFPYWTNMKLSKEGNLTFAEYRFVVTSEVSISSFIFNSGNF